MQNQQIIHLCAGIQYSIGCLIANSGENCGFSYTLDSSYIAIYTSKPIKLNFVIATQLMKLFNHSYSDLSNSNYETWRECGDKSPEFSYDERLSNQLCIVFNFFYNDCLFKPTDLHLRNYTVYTNEVGNRQTVYNVSSLYSINNDVRNLLYNNMMKSLTHATVLKWYYKKHVFSNQIDASRTPQQVIPMATNNSIIKISCGYVYPFDEITTISENKYKCICHRPIFTIFSSCNLSFSTEEANMINDIIDKLSPLSIYIEEQKIGDNTYRYVFNTKLTEFIVNVFTLLFSNRYKFVFWEFTPEDSIEYINSSRIIRRYKHCVNLNALIYSLFEHLICANDKYRYFKTYPVDCLYKFDVETDYGDFPF